MPPTNGRRSRKRTRSAARCWRRASPSRRLIARSPTRSRRASGRSGASTQTSRGLAGGIIGAIDRDAVFNAPAAGLALVQADLKDLKADDVSAAPCARPLRQPASVSLQHQADRRRSHARFRLQSRGIGAGGNGDAAEARRVAVTNFGAPGKLSRPAISTISMRPWSASRMACG